MTCRCSNTLERMRRTRSTSIRWCRPQVGSTTTPKCMLPTLAHGIALSQHVHVAAPVYQACSSSAARAAAWKAGSRDRTASRPNGARQYDHPLCNVGKGASIAIRCRRRVWRFACDQRQRPVLEGAIGKVSTLGMIGVKIPLIVMRWLGHLLRIGRCSQIRVICVAEDRDAYQAAFGPLLLSSRLYGYRTRDTLSAPEEYHGETQGDDDGDVWSNVFSTASLRRYEAAWGAFSCDQMVAAKLVDDDNGPHLLGGPVPMDASSTNDSLAAARAPHMPSRHRCSSSAPCTNRWRPCPCVSPRAGSSHDQVQERAGDRGSSSPQMPQHGG